MKKIWNDLRIIFTKIFDYIREPVLLTLMMINVLILILAAIILDMPLVILSFFTLILIAKVLL